MRMIEVRGTPEAIGRATGEALREEIHAHIEMYPMARGDEFWRRAPGVVAVLEEHLPHVLAEMRATAAAANVPEEEILRLNLPMPPHELDVDGCSNVVFTGGTDGPVWGKNNDGNVPHRPVVGRYVKPDHGIPFVLFIFAGMLGTVDGMNAEGLAVGHSSVGSVFQQSDAFLPIRLWGYEGMMRCRTSAEFIRHMAARPLRGKGFSLVCVDRAGEAFSLEAPCPLMQVRRPSAAHGVCCVNCYQLPALAEADRRTPEAKEDALARARVLDQVLDGDGSLDVAQMQDLLRRHGDPGLCRHGECNMITEYSMVGLPQQGRVLYLAGHPCEEEYEELVL